MAEARGATLDPVGAMAGHAAGGTDAPMVAVVGAGIAGLAAAWELAAAGARVVVLEASAAPGGKLQPVTVAGVTVDAGPDAFLARRPEAADLCREVGLGDELVAPGASGAALWARGRLRPLPEGLVLGVPTRLVPLARSGIVGPAELVPMVADLLRWSRRGRGPSIAPERATDSSELATRSSATDRSVAELVVPHLGRAVTGQLVDPMVGGIHAGPVTAMSAEAVFPALLAAAARPGSLARSLRAGVQKAGPPAAPVFLTIRGGLHLLPARLAERLAGLGAMVRTSTPVSALVPPDAPGACWRLETPQGAVAADGVVLAVPAPVAARLLAGGVGAATGGPGGALGANPVGRLIRYLGAVDYGGVAVVTLAFAPGGRAERWRRADGTGFLVPVRQGLLVTGGTWLSAKWPELAPGGPVLVRLSAGRWGDGRALALDDRSLVRRLLAELRTVAGGVDDPVDTAVTRWHQALPQYRVGQRRWAAGVAAATAALPALAVAGAAYDGVGVPACVATGRRAAGQVLAQLAPSRHPEPEVRP